MLDSGKTVIAIVIMSRKRKRKGKEKGKKEEAGRRREQKEKEERKKVKEKRDQTSQSIGNQPLISTGMTDAEDEAQILGHMMQRANSLEKTLILGKIEGRRRRGQQRMKWLDGIINSVEMSSSKLRERVKDKAAWNASVHKVKHN